MAFKESLKEAKIHEKNVCVELEKLGLKLVNYNDDYRYDLKMFSPKLNKDVTFEIKTDLTTSECYDSGDFFIEFQSRGKQSGITVTEADYFIIYLYFFNQIYLFNTNKLKEICSNTTKMSDPCGEDGSDQVGYYINRDSVKDSYTIIETEKHFTGIDWKKIFKK
jgi:hypothetical protein